MSADNYVYVGRSEDGKYAISHRCASMHYKDEETEAPMEAYGIDGDQEGWRLRGDSVHGDTVFPSPEAALAAATRHPDWLVDPPAPRATYDTAEQALIGAHQYVAELHVVEYGVVVGEGVLPSSLSS